MIMDKIPRPQYSHVALDLSSMLPWDIHLSRPRCWMIIMPCHVVFRRHEYENKNDGRVIHHDRESDDSNSGSLKLVINPKQCDFHRWVITVRVRLTYGTCSPFAHRTFILCMVCACYASEANRPLTLVPSVLRSFSFSLFPICSCIQWISQF